MFKKATLILFTALIVPSAWSQSSSGTVSGTVRDQSGAVIPNAVVELTNTATNVTSSSRTNDAGFYIYPVVAIGSYQISVESPGMQRYQAAITVALRQSIVVEPVLNPGQTATTLVVQDVTPLVTVDSPALRQGMERARIEQLPINGRSITTLVGLLPGFEGGRTFGSPQYSQEYILDGSMESGRRWGGLDITPSIDSIQEFAVEANAISAKFSRPVSIVMSTKSGTNGFHGTAFETHRNSAIGVARQRQDTFTTPPKLIRNEFGFTGGAPVILPKIYDGRNRTFWFLSYEGQRRVQGSTVQYHVPTEAMRNGDFSGLVDSAGRRITIYDPLTTGANGVRQPFNFGGKLNNIDPARISPVAKYLYSITPSPTHPEVNPLIDQNWRSPFVVPSRYYAVAGRFDHRVSDRDNVYARLTWGQTWSRNSISGGGQPGGPMLNDVAGYEYNIVPNRSGAISWVRNVGPTLFNELLVSVHRSLWSGGEGPADGPWADQLGLPNPFGVPYWPRFEGTGLGSGTSAYALNTNDTKKNYFTYWNVDDNVTKILNKHELQFGFHWRKDFLNTLPQQRFPQPQVNWGTLATALVDPTTVAGTNPVALPQTGANIANMYLGHSSISTNLVKGWYYLRGTEYALYFQDNYKITPRLTLNLGLRWEYWPAFTEKNNTLVGFDLPSKSFVLNNDLNSLYAQGVTLPSLVNALQGQGVQFKTWQDVNAPRDLVNPQKGNLGPRLGFAYRALEGKRSFVVRGGYSTSYFNVRMANWFDLAWQNTPLRATYQYNPNSAALSPDGVQNWLLRNRPQYTDGVNTRDIIDLSRATGINRGSANVAIFVNPDLPTSRVHTWNLTLEKEVMASTVARARYIGTRGANVNQLFNYNPNPPDYVYFSTTGQPLPTGEFSGVARRPYENTVLGNVQQYNNTGFNNYNGIELELERRFSRGYGFQLYYIHSNALIMDGNVLNVNQYMPGLVPADYDERNRFVNYRRDSGIPKHRVRWNWLVDLPFGKGKMFGRNAGGVLDRFIGGWQIAGLGQLRSNYIPINTTNWPNGENIETYGYQYPIQDCRSGNCIPGYLWWNGYIPAHQINSVDANGKPNGIMGVPANYKPAVSPLIPFGSTTRPPNMPANVNLQSHWGTNNVWIPLNNGAVVQTAYAPGLNPYQNQFIPGVRNWTVDASLFKRIPINERIYARLNVDFFNVFNVAGNPNSVDAMGFLATRNSANAARVLQLTLRLAW